MIGVDKIQELLKLVVFTGRLKNEQPTKHQTRPLIRWASFVVGVLMLAGFSFWTVLILRDGFHWRAVITAYAAFSGLAVIFLPSFMEAILPRRFRRNQSV
jgi:hypothetical protein